MRCLGDLCDLFIKLIVKMLSKPKWPGSYPPAPDNGTFVIECPPEQNYIKNRFITGQLLDVRK